MTKSKKRRLPPIDSSSPAEGTRPASSHRGAEANDDDDDDAHSSTTDRAAIAIVTAAVPSSPPPRPPSSMANASIVERRTTHDNATTGSGSFAGIESPGRTSTNEGCGERNDDDDDKNNGDRIAWSKSKKKRMRRKEREAARRRMSSSSTTTTSATVAHDDGRDSDEKRTSNVGDGMADTRTTTTTRTMTCSHTTPVSLSSGGKKKRQRMEGGEEDDGGGETTRMEGKEGGEGDAMRKMAPRDELPPAISPSKSGSKIIDTAAHDPVYGDSRKGKERKMAQDARVVAVDRMAITKSDEQQHNGLHNGTVVLKSPSSSCKPKGGGEMISQSAMPSKRIDDDRVGRESTSKSLDGTNIGPDSPGRNIDDEFHGSPKKKKSKKKKKKKEGEGVSSPMTTTTGVAVGSKESSRPPPKNSSINERADDRTIAEDDGPRVKISIPKPSQLSTLQRDFLERLTSSRFRELNEELYTHTSRLSFERFTERPELFDQYHVGFRKQAESWPVNPIDVIYKKIVTGWTRDRQKEEGGGEKAMERRGKEKTVIADFGCGDAKLAERLLALRVGRDGRSLAQASAKTTSKGDVCPFKVFSFDLVSGGNPLVTPADMSDVPLPDEGVDVAVYSLALMGTNVADFVREAWRVLRFNGVLRVAEVRSRFETASGCGPYDDDGTVTGKRGKSNNGMRHHPAKAVSGHNRTGRRDAPDDGPKPIMLLDEFMSLMERCGFQCTYMDRSNKMFLFMDFVKLDGSTGLSDKERFTAKACIYKKR